MTGHVTAIAHRIDRNPIPAPTPRRGGVPHAPRRPWCRRTDLRGRAGMAGAEHPQESTGPRPPPGIESFRHAPQRCRRAHLGTDGVLDDRDQREVVHVPRQVDDRSRRRCEPHPVVSNHDILVVEQRGPVRPHPGFPTRMAARRGDDVNEPVLGNASQAPKSPGGRSGHHQFGPACAQGGASRQFRRLDAPQRVRTIHDPNEQAGLDQHGTLVGRDAARDQCIGRDGGVVLATTAGQSHRERPCQERTPGVSHRRR